MVEPKRRRERRTVTVLFADLVGSTALGERLDAEVFDSILEEYAAIARDAIARHGGTVEKFAGDGVLAVFGVPTVHEDDALRAGRAAVAFRDGVAALAARIARDLPVELEMRMALHTGEVVAPEGSDDRLVAGDTVNTAARLQSAAGPGEILLGASTASLLADAAVTDQIDAVVLKGKAHPVPAFRLLSIRPGAEAITRRLDGPLVGRRAELAALENVFDDVVRHRIPRILTVVGPPGIGKSRLVAAFAATAQVQARFHRGRCLPYGDGIAYWPIRELLFDAAGISASDDRNTARRELDRLMSAAPDGPALSSRLQALFRLNDEAITAAEIPSVIRRTFETLAAERPLVAILDDVQWADPEMLDVLESVAERSTGSSILLLTIARPELAERRPEWFARPELSIIRLDTLAPEETQILVATLLGRDATTQIGALIAEAAEGNPLFVEQLVAMLRDGGRLDGLAASSVADEGSALPIPASIQALLAARLDALPALDRSILQRGSVVGRTFWWGAVSELSPEPDRVGVGSSLARLVRSDFLRPDQSIFDADEAYRFRHLLVRDAAYSSLSKTDRAELHAGFADWLVTRVGDRAEEYAEILGYHYEQSFEYNRAILGTDGDERERVGNAAAAWLADAARRARARADSRSAAKLASRVLVLRPLPDPGSRSLLPEFIDSLLDLGDFASADDWLDQGRVAADDANDELLDAWCLVVRSRLGSLRRENNATLSEESLATATRAFERFSDERGLAQIVRDRATRAWGLGRMVEAAKEFEAAALHAQRGGLLAEAANDRSFALVALSIGPLSVDETLAAADVALASDIDPQSAAEVNIMRSTALASVGRIDEARVAFHEGQSILLELGHQWWAEGVRGQLAAFIEKQAGDLDAARDLLEGGVRAAEAIGERSYASTTVALLADVLCDLGRFEEALEMSRVSEDSSNPEDVMSEVMWRSARARALANGGQRREAEQLMARALELAESTDMTGFRGDVWRHAADMGSTLDRSQADQIAALDEARRLYTEKGWSVMSDRMQDRIGALGASKHPAT
jgi:class 3 adenylate cyclase/tetratricopeptide (TPR) repeat protein